MTLLSTQTIAGDGTEKEIELPESPSPGTKIAFIFDGYTEDLELRQSADGVAVRIPASAQQPFPMSPFRLRNAPDRILVEDGDSVDITIMRLHQ